MAQIVMAMDETQAGIIGYALTKALRAERSELAIARLRSAQGPAAEGCRERVARLEEALLMLDGCPGAEAAVAEARSPAERPVMA